MSHFPPFPPTQSGRYSPNRAYRDRPPFPPPIPPFPTRDFPPYPYPSSAPPPPSSAYRPYDAYPPEPSRPSYPPYEQPRGPYEDHYDPYQPSVSTYNSVPPPMRVLPPTYAPTPMQEPHRRQVRPISPPPRRPVPPHPRPDNRHQNNGPPDLKLSTHPTTVNIGGFTAAVHSLPPSHLPITKYVSLNRDDAIDLHRQLCSSRSSVWYADGSSRAGEAWCAAVEWRLDLNLGGSKMRGHLSNGDALDAELGGLYKAAEGFRELLQQSIKDGHPVPHELTVFCDSQAAIVGIDTSSREEAIKFESLWRDICSEYLYAHMTLVWIPKDSGVEGHILADRIATVGASNSYTKRRKDRTLPDIYMRPGGGEHEPSASSEPGPWQMGDADPTRLKISFIRPQPVAVSPPIITRDIESDTNDLKLDLGAVEQVEQVSSEGPDGEDEGIQPQAGAIFVTHVAVDIFHISPSLPRYANVTFSDPASGVAAINDLHRKPIKLDSPFARENEADLGLWKAWDGQLTVVLHEPPRIVPSAVEADFPDLPDWARGGEKDAHKNEEEETMEVEGQIKEERSPSPESDGKKRDREDPTANGTLNLESTSSRSPKRLRQENYDEHGGIPQGGTEEDSARKSSIADHIHALPLTATKQAISDLTESLYPAKVQQIQAVVASTAAIPQSPALEVILPPFPPTLKTEAVVRSESPPSSFDNVLPVNGGVPDHLSTRTLPPTPLTAVPFTNGALTSSTITHQSPAQSNTSSPTKPTVMTSASEPQEHPIKMSVKTLRAHLTLVRTSLAKHEPDNWIAHTCLIAHDIDHARRSLQADLYATDESFISGREWEKQLTAKGFTSARIDAFVTKVLKVLDGIAAAEEPESDQPDSVEDVERLQAELTELLDIFPNETKEAMASAARMMEFLVRGKDLQEKKRIEVERRVKVLEGMVKVGEVVSGVVRYLLTEDK
uniref:RNase H type-1 domain-containing protein n=1 Tax=Kwoniella pini CBS 10737 TaxID=1296096 RepID=A0A1B9I8D2_9TREE|nr:uncharacterized protein I206_02470 [Kwoniella pini CBS 10737]OCF51754.1 hypothetical protein I206_02470 [Kwoniella pini CBS 10737]